jgi:hypothetical protein
MTGMTCPGTLFVNPVHAEYFAFGITGVIIIDSQGLVLKKVIEICVILGQRAYGQKIQCNKK